MPYFNSSRRRYDPSILCICFAGIATRPFFFHSSAMEMRSTPSRASSIALSSGEVYVVVGSIFVSCGK